MSHHFSNATIFHRSVLFTTARQVEQSQMIGFYFQFSKETKTTFNATVGFYEPQLLQMDINNTRMNSILMTKPRSFSSESHNSFYSRPNDPHFYFKVTMTLC